MSITITIDLSDDVKALLRAAIGSLQPNAAQESRIVPILDDLEAEVAANTSLKEAIATVIGNINSTVAANATDPKRLAAVLATLQANDARLAALAIQGTVAPPVTVPPPVTPPAPTPAAVAAVTQAPAA